MRAAKPANRALAHLTRRGGTLFGYPVAMSSAARAVIVNGEPTPVPAGSTVSELLAQLDLRGRKVAVAINRAVVPRSSYADRTLDAGDRVEILEAVGGG